MKQASSLRFNIPVSSISFLFTSPKTFSITQHLARIEEHWSITAPLTRTRIHRFHINLYYVLLVFTAFTLILRLGIIDSLAKIVLPLLYVVPRDFLKRPSFVTIDSQL